MVCLSMILLCYRITCLWFCNKKGVLFVPDPVFCYIHFVDNSLSKFMPVFKQIVTLWFDFIVRVLSNFVVKVVPVSKKWKRGVLPFPMKEFTSKTGRPEKCKGKMFNYLTFKYQCILFNEYRTTHAYVTIPSRFCHFLALDIQQNFTLIFILASMAFLYCLLFFGPE